MISLVGAVDKAVDIRDKMHTGHPFHHCTLHAHRRGREMLQINYKTTLKFWKSFEIKAYFETLRSQTNIVVGLVVGLATWI